MKKERRKRGCLKFTLIGIGGCFLLGIIASIGEDITQQPSEKPVEVPPRKKSAPIKAYAYEQIAREDISHGATSRLVLRIRLDTEELPNEKRMKKTAEQIWKKEGKQWKEFTVAMIYGDIPNFNFGSYGTAEYRPSGLLEFRINQDFIMLWNMKQKVKN